MACLLIFSHLSVDGLQSKRGAHLPDWRCAGRKELRVETSSNGKTNETPHVTQAR
jgi:hypothetical protein